MDSFACKNRAFPKEAGCVQSLEGSTVLGGGLCFGGALYYSCIVSGSNFRRHARMLRNLCFVHINIADRLPGTWEIGPAVVRLLRVEREALSSVTVQLLYYGVLSSFMLLTQPSVKCLMVRDLGTFTRGPTSKMFPSGLNQVNSKYSISESDAESYSRPSDLSTSPIYTPPHPMMVYTYV